MPPLLNATTTDAELAACDLVIEAVVENPEVKRQVFARLEPQLHEDAILASNTSTIPITQLAAGAEAARAVLRHPLLQSRAKDAAGGSDPRQEIERRNDRHGRGLCQIDRQIADRGERRPRLPGQPPAVAVHERGDRAVAGRGGNRRHRPGGQELRHADGADHAVRRGRPRHRFLRRPRDVRRLSRSRRRLAGRAGADQGRPAGAKIGRGFLRVCRRQRPRRARSGAAKRCWSRCSAASRNSPKSN